MNLKSSELIDERVWAMDGYKYKYSSYVLVITPYVYFIGEIGWFPVLV